MKLVAYVRASTEEQQYSPQAQRGEIEAWAQREGHSVVSWRSDQVSGSKDVLERPGLATALLEASNGVAEGLVVWKLDRLSRRLLVQETIIDQLRREGRPLFSVREPDLCSPDPERVLVRQIMGAIAEYERAIIGIRTRLGMQRARAAGKQIGRVSCLPPAVGELARGLRSEGLTLAEVGEELSLRGFPPPRGEKWWPGTVRRMMRGSLPPAPAGTSSTPGRFSPPSA